MTPMPKPIDLCGRRLGGAGRALICAPLVGRSLRALHAELDAILPLAPDLVEWRVDFFDAVADTDAVLAAAAALRARGRRAARAGRGRRRRRVRGHMREWMRGRRRL